jgi:hypothetical protein
MNEELKEFGRNLCGAIVGFFRYMPGKSEVTKTSVKVAGIPSEILTKHHKIRALSLGQPVQSVKRVLKSCFPGQFLTRWNIFLGISLL